MGTSVQTPSPMLSHTRLPSAAESALDKKFDPVHLIVPFSKAEDREKRKKIKEDELPLYLK